MSALSQVHSWARYVADVIHVFYMKAAEHLENEHEDDWQHSRWYNGGEYFMVEMHLFALQRLSEWRASHPRDAHITLHEFFRAGDPVSFAEDYWEHRGPTLTNRAQALINKNDKNKPLGRPERVAKAILDSYGETWVDMADEDFKEAWDWAWLVDGDEGPVITWDEA